MSFFLPFMAYVGLIMFVWFAVLCLIYGFITLVSMVIDLFRR